MAWWERTRLKTSFRIENNDQRCYFFWKNYGYCWNCLSVKEKKLKHTQKKTINVIMSQKRNNKNSQKLFQKFSGIQLCSDEMFVLYFLFLKNYIMKISDPRQKKKIKIRQKLSTEFFNCETKWMWCHNKICLHKTIFAFKVIFRNLLDQRILLALQEKNFVGEVKFILFFLC